MVSTLTEESCPVLSDTSNATLNTCTESLYVSLSPPHTHTWKLPSDEVNNLDKIISFMELAGWLALGLHRDPGSRPQQPYKACYPF